MTETSRTPRILIFDEDRHTYALDDVVFVSVTSFISSFVDEPDVATMIESRRAEWKNQEECVYNGMTDREIAEDWERIRDEASTAGKKMHKMIEDDITMEMKGISIEGRNFDAEFATEMKAYRKFRTKHPDWTPFATETTVFDETLGICGTFDAIFYDKKEETYVLLDWKRCKSLDSGSEERRFSHPALEGVACGNSAKYLLQLCTYKWCVDRGCGEVDYVVKVMSEGKDPWVYEPGLKKCAGKISKCFVMNFHPNLGGFYQKLELDANFEKEHGLPFLESQIPKNQLPSKRFKKSSK